MAHPTSPRAPGRPDDALDDARAGPEFEELIAEVSARFITLPPGEVEAEITRTLSHPRGLRRGGSPACGWHEACYLLGESTSHAGRGIVHQTGA
jgi:hypothetical protein